MEANAQTKDGHQAETTLSALRARYADVRSRIAAAARRVGRDPGAILLVAVTKHAEPDQIRELIRLGHADFAENRVQHLVQRASLIEEWLARHRSLPSAAPDTLPAVRWHMIGHLQRNKARKVLELCRLIHSVDTLRLAEELQSIAVRKDQTVDVLLQVNASEERSKYGCVLPAALHLAEQIDTMAHLRLRGVMTMAPYSDDPEDARPIFQRTYELFHEIRRAGIASAHLDILSMGMSNDFEVAIEEGANLVRVGSAIFGQPANTEPDTEEEPDGAA